MFGKLPFLNRKQKKTEEIAYSPSLLKDFKTEKAIHSRKLRSQRYKAVPPPANDRLKRQSSFKNKKSRFILLVGGIVLITLVVGLFKAPFFMIRSVSVQDEGISCADTEQIKTLSRIQGKNILFISAYNLELYLQKKILCAKTVLVDKKYPNNITFILTPRVAVAQIEAFNAPIKDDLKTIEASSSTQEAQVVREYIPGDKVGLFQVDTSGLLFDLGSPSVKVPQFQLSLDGLGLGRRVDLKTLNTALAVIKKLQELGLPYKGMKFEEDSIYIQSNPLILMSQKLDYRRQLAILQLIMQKAKLDRVGVKMIDLRFDKPVVRYGPKLG